MATFHSITNITATQNGSLISSDRSISRIVEPTDNRKPIQRRRIELSNCFFMLNHNSNHIAIQGVAASEDP